MSGLKLEKRGNVWRAVGSIAGERIRTSLRTGDERQARELLADLEARIWRRRTYGEAAVRTFAEAALDYQRAGKEGAFLAPLILRFGDRLVGSISGEEIREAAAALYPTAAPATWNRQAIVPARAVINYAARKGWCAPVSVQMYSVPRPRRAAVGDDWFDRLIGQCDADRLPHLAALMLFLRTTGTRLGEAVRVLPEHLDLAGGLVELERTKTAAWERRHIGPELVARLANLARAPGRPVFGYRHGWAVIKRLKAVCRRAGIPYVGTHQAGRHSFATAAIAAGATLKEVMDAAGWRSARMVLEIYAHTNEPGKRLAELLERPAKGRGGKGR